MEETGTRSYSPAASDFDAVGDHVVLHLRETRFGIGIGSVNWRQLSAHVGNCVLIDECSGDFDPSNEIGEGQPIVLKLTDRMTKSFVVLDLYHGLVEGLRCAVEVADGAPESLVLRVRHQVEEALHIGSQRAPRHSITSGADAVLLLTVRRTGGRCHAVGADADTGAGRHAQRAELCRSNRTPTGRSSGQQMLLQLNGGCR
nr:hypothetical protein [Rhodococcus pseudokoreensis]